MGRYIDWYLVEVEQRLGATLSREKVHETLGEVEAHLLAAKDEALQRGMHDTDAELAAVESFGPARRFAAAFVQETAPVVLKWIHILAALLACSGIVITSGVFVAYPELWLTALWLVGIAFIFFSARATRPAKWQSLGAIVAASTLLQLMIAGIIYVPIESHVSTSYIERTRAADIVAGKWQPRKSLSGRVHPMEENLPVRAQAALQATYLQSVGHFVAPLVGFNAVAFGALLAVHYAGFGFGVMGRRIRRRRLLA